MITLSARKICFNNIYYIIRAFVIFILIQIFEFLYFYSNRQIVFVWYKIKLLIFDQNSYRLD